MRWIALSAVGLLIGACVFDWDRYAPSVESTGGSGNGGDAVGGSDGGAAGMPVTPSGGMGGEGGGGAFGGSGMGGLGGMGGIGGMGGTPILTVTLPATIAECVAPMAPDPDACEAKVGAGHMNVDLVDGPLMGPPEHAFLRFQIDDALVGHTILSAELVLTVGMIVGADSPSSGELWEVSAFDLMTLDTEAPDKLGADPLALDPGAAGLGAVITFSIPAASIDAGEPLYLGVFAVSDQGVNYENNAGASPPELTIRYQ